MAMRTLMLVTTKEVLAIIKRKTFATMTVKIEIVPLRTIATMLDLAKVATGVIFVTMTGSIATATVTESCANGRGAVPPPVSRERTIDVTDSQGISMVPVAPRTISTRKIL